MREPSKCPLARKGTSASLAVRSRYSSSSSSIPLQDEGFANLHSPLWAAYSTQTAKHNSPLSFFYVYVSHFVISHLDYIQVVSYYLFVVFIHEWLVMRDRGNAEMVYQFYGGGWGQGGKSYRDVYFPDVVFQDWQLLWDVLQTQIPSRLTHLVSFSVNQYGGCSCCESHWRWTGSIMHYCRLISHHKSPIKLDWHWNRFLFSLMPSGGVTGEAQGARGPPVGVTKINVQTRNFIATESDNIYTRMHLHINNTLFV